MFDFFWWTITCSGILSLVIFALKSTQEKGGAIIKLLERVNAVLIKIGSIAIVCFTIYFLPFNALFILLLSYICTTCLYFCLMLNTEFFIRLVTQYCEKVC